MNVKVGHRGLPTLPDGRPPCTRRGPATWSTRSAYLPKGGDVSTLGYWYPHDKGGIIGSDMIAIPANAEHPVLAHLFLDYMLEREGALDNFNGIGYQQPHNALDPERVIAEGYVPENAVQTRSCAKPTSTRACSCCSCRPRVKPCGTTPGRSSRPVPEDAFE